MPSPALRLPDEGLKLACLQLNVGGDPAANLPAFDALVRQAARQGAQLIATPECSNFIGENRSATLAAARSEGQDEHLKSGLALAQELGVWLLLGSLIIKVPGRDTLANRQFLIDPNGQIRARYDKIHLFDVTLPGGEVYRESQTYAAGGERLVSGLGPQLASHAGKGWHLGHAICFDLRFPQLFQALARDGAQILTLPSAFTQTTGQAHWHPLLRARAIETGCYVCAPAQAGQHNAKRQSYGHSLIIDPWGRILAEASADQPGVILAELSLQYLKDCRARIPTLDLSQPDAYL